MSLTDRLPRLPMPAAFRPAQPALAAEIGERAITFARLTLSGGRPELAGFWCGELPDGAVRAATLQQNIVDAEAVRSQVRAARARIAPSGGPIALCLPDPVVRVALLHLESMPAHDAEVHEMVAWRLKKQIPYRVEEARVAWKTLGDHAGSTLVLAAAVRRKILAELEGVFEDEGFDVGSVTTGTLALAETLPSSPGDVLLVHVSDGWFSLLLADAGKPILIRSKQLPPSQREGEGRDAAIAAELAPTLEYAAQRLSRSTPPNVRVHDATGGGDALSARLAEASGLHVSRLQPVPPAPVPPGVADRIGAACALALRGLGDGTTGGAR